jgi:hypothetical protein
MGGLHIWYWAITFDYLWFGCPIRPGAEQPSLTAEMVREVLGGRGVLLRFDGALDGGPGLKARG